MLILTIRNLGFEFLHLLFIVAASLLATISQHQYFMNDISIELMFRNTFFASVIGTTIVTFPITIMLMTYYTRQNIDLWTHPNIRMQSLLRLAISTLSAPTGIAIGTAIARWQPLQILQVTLATTFGIITIVGTSYLLGMFGGGLVSPTAGPIRRIAGDYSRLPTYVMTPSEGLRYQPSVETGGVLRPLLINHRADERTIAVVENDADILSEGRLPAP